MFASRKDIPSNDNKTLRALKKGKRWAFKKIFDTYHLKLYHFARNMGLSHEDGECIVQEVFISIWEKKHLIDENQYFKSYLYTITKRLTIKKVKRQALEDRYKSKEAQKSSCCNKTEDYIVFKNLLDHASANIDQLPEERKQIFLLSKHEGLTNQEIADRLNISKRTVENQLYRATKTLKGQINTDYMFN
ncbi:RNA polymerase sigma-70 factor [Fulvivirga sp. RKSG066]|uniref:RNA polymerase sigma-70 factor n=1 Tax=Fulvivirga aurantia TaxID=2529383 RepID=UPI0012BBBF1B|nr:RNA polymerase sigma-70 factor [Fulvivirga aurantia]MTI20594.1 RNA polymerase sigma-70 factor [Fulvivirga aurantia]